MKVVDFPAQIRFPAKITCQFFSHSIGNPATLLVEEECHYCWVVRRPIREGGGGGWVGRGGRQVGEAGFKEVGKICNKEVWYFF